MLLDKKVSDYFDRKIPKGDIGIEIEAEFNGVPPPGFVTDFWKTEQDGSLRNGLEYTSNNPVPYKHLRDALNEFAAKTKDFNFRESIRTSVHVHFNAGRLTMKEVFQVAVAYWLFENVLVEPHGSLRRGNLYCLRAKDADDIVNAVCDTIKYLQGVKKIGGFPTVNLWGDNYRYAALNFAALGKYGSMEFRFMSGTTDTEEIYFWVDLLYQLFTNSVQLDVKRMVELAGAGRAEKELLLTTLIGKDKKEKLLSLVESSWPDMVEENVPYAMRVLAALERKDNSASFAKPYILSTRFDDLETDAFVDKDNTTFAPRKQKLPKTEKYVHHPFENVKQEQNYRLAPGLPKRTRNACRLAKRLNEESYTFPWDDNIWYISPEQFKSIRSGIPVTIGSVTLGEPLTSVQLSTSPATLQWYHNVAQGVDLSPGSQNYPPENDMTVFFDEIEMEQSVAPQIEAPI